jgi:hypothetical protein
MRVPFSQHPHQHLLLVMFYFFFWKDYICREEKRKTTWWGIMQGDPENSGHLVVFLMIAILTGGILVWF